MQVQVGYCWNTVRGMQVISEECAVLGGGIELWVWLQGVGLRAWGLVCHVCRCGGDAGSWDRTN